MKEDILEQLVDDYLQFKGYLTIHNLKFKPAATDRHYFKKHDCVPSDIDVVGIHPLKRGRDRVWVVSCKAWQVGLNPKSKIAKIKHKKVESGRQAWKGFRELAVRKWSVALIAEIEKLTGTKKFTHVTAVTKLNGDRSEWEQHPVFQKNLQGNPIKILTLKEILDELYEKTGTTVASSQVGRLLQVVKASGWRR